MLRVMTSAKPIAVETDATVASVLRLAVMRLRRRLANERDPHNDLSLRSMGVLSALVPGGEMTLGALAAQERVQPPSMSRTVDFLQEGGYVVRRSSDADRRQVIVAITDHGREVVLADRERRDAWLAQRLAELTPEERDALRAAAPVLQKLAEW